MKTLYESILDDINISMEKGDVLIDSMKTFSWIAGIYPIQLYKDIPGGMKKNVELLIGKKQKDIKYWFGPICDRIVKKYDTILVEKTAKYRTDFFNWINAIVLNTKFKNNVEEEHIYGICHEIAFNLANTLNEMRLEGVKDKFEVTYFEVKDGMLSFTLLIKNDSTGRRNRLCKCSFVISEEFYKNRKGL